MIRERTFYLVDVAAALQITPRWVYLLINRHPELFGGPEARRYRRKGRHPRKHRVLTSRDITFLRSLLYVNRNLQPPRTG